MTSEFESQDFDIRKNTAIKLAQVYPERIPIILAPKPGTQLAKLPQERLLIPEHYCIGHIIKHVRNALDLEDDKSIFLYVNGRKMLKIDEVAGAVFSNHRQPDGFLYITYNETSTFG